MSSRFLPRLCCVAAFSVSAMLGCSKEPEVPATTQAEKSKSDSGSKDGVAKAQTLVQEAVAEIQKRQFATAVGKLTEAIQLDRQCAEAYFQRAGIFADVGQDRLALNDYSKAIELNAKDVRYFNMRGLYLLTRRQYESASEDFAAAIQLEPNYVQAYNNRGLVHLAKSDFSAAVSDFNKAVEIDTKYVDGFNNRGFAWYQSGAYDKALADFNKTIELNNKYVNAYNNRAMLYMQLKKYREAVRDFSTAIKYDENNAKHYQNRRTAYLELGQQKEADTDGDKIAWLTKLNDLNAAIAKAPKEAKNYVQRASHLAKAGKSEIALTNFETAIKVAPDSSDGFAGRASYWMEQGDYQRAIEDCNQALERQWSHHTLSIRADAYSKIGQYDEAIADYTSAKRLDETVAEAYYRRGLQRQKQGNQEGARSDLEVAKQLNPEIGN